MRTVTTELPLGAVQEEVVLPSENDSVLRSQFALDREQHELRGHVGWADSCRRAVVERGRSRRLTHSVPNREAGVAAGIGALGAGVGSAVFFSHLDAFSREESCSTDDGGQSSCGSPRGGATALAVLLATTAVALAATSAVTFARHASEQSNEVVLGPPGQPRTVESGVACGRGAVDGLGVLVYQGMKHVAGASSDANGDVLVRLPTGLSGQVTVVADPASWRYEFVAPTEVLAAFDVPP